MVSGSGVYTGRHVAGSPGSSSGNREGTEVASQASVTLPTTSAESVVSQEGTQHFNIGDHGSPLSLAMSALKEQLVGQQSALNLMLDMESVLQIISSKSKSPQVQAAIRDVLNAVEVITNAHDKVVRSFKSTMRTAQDHVYNCPKPGGEKPRSSKSIFTQTQIEVTATKAATNNADTVLNNADVSNRLDKQEEKLEKIMAYLTAAKDFLVSSIKIESVKRRYTDNDTTKKSCTKLYYLPVHEELRKVCQQFVLKTLDISQTVLRYTDGNKNNILNISKSEKRGKKDLGIRQKMIMLKGLKTLLKNYQQSLLIIVEVVL
ncbi:hypothetical protein QTP88_019978 [Uroleucon formosanum]